MEMARKKKNIYIYKHINNIVLSQEQAHGATHGVQLVKLEIFSYKLLTGDSLSVEHLKQCRFCPRRT